MGEKFSYYDFLAYFVPGVFLASVIIYSLNEVTSGISLTTGNTILDPIIFLVFSFVLGHFIQFRGRFGLEKRLKEKKWGGWVSEQYLIKGNPFCPEVKRRIYINLAFEKLGFKKEDLEVLEKEDLKGENKNKAMETSQDIYRSCLTLITDKGIGEKAKVANTYYSFFRGVSVTSFYSTIIILILVGYQFYKIYILKTPIKTSHVIINLVALLLLGYLWYCFKERARDRGEIHVREVFDSFSGLYT